MPLRPQPAPVDPRSRVAASVQPSGVCVAAATMPPPAQMRRDHPRQDSLRRRVQRDGRLVEQPQGARPRRAAGQGPAAASAPPRDRRRARLPVRPAPALRRRHGLAIVPPQEIGKKFKVFGHGERRFDPVQMADIVALLADALLLIAAAQLDAARRAAAGTRRARAAGSSCPTPFGPVSVSASPAPISKLTPRKISRVAARHRRGH